MGNWPTGWREHTLRNAGIEINQFALDVLHMWEQATPTDRWTNNPLGMPSSGYSAPRAFNSPYAAFPTMTAFYKAFRTAAHAKEGKPLHVTLSTSDKHSEAWRVIHSLGWPANATETDYPATLLDKLTDDAIAKLNVSPKGQRKTVGVATATKSQHQQVHAQSQAVHHAASHINDSARAIEYIVRKLGTHG